VSSAPLAIDAAGTAHPPAGRGARIVSLVPSLTELLFDLGLGASIVGRTDFCIHPAADVRPVASVGGTKRVDLDRVRALAPTHVVVNVDETPRHVADALAAMGYAVVVTHPVEADDNLALYALFGRLFDCDARAAALAADYGAARAELTADARDWPHRRVLYLIWRKPWKTVAPDTYIARTLSLARWHTIADRGVRYPDITIDAAVLSGVDHVLFSSEPFPFGERHLAAFRAAFPAHADKALLIDGQMVSWYGSRAIAGLHYLSAFAAHALAARRGGR
jgi:ABC-type Fe3+-hydroxamate transport system substrate-binding protein